MCDFVVSVVDAVQEKWPRWEQLVEMGMPEEMAREWATIRFSLSPYILKKLVEESRS